MYGGTNQYERGADFAASSGSPKNNYESNNALNASMVSAGGVGSQLAEVELQLFNRLLKVGIIRASPNIKPLYDQQKVQLDPATSVRYLNGHIFASYLLVLKQVML